MPITLSKGQSINLAKSTYDLSHVTVGLGWDVAEPSSGGGFIGKLFGAKPPEEYDLDVIAFLLGANGKVVNRGDTKLQGGDVIFFNNLKHRSGRIWLTGDNRTGAGDGDDEQIIVDLNGLDQQYQQIVFVVQIYQGQQRGQHFGAVKNAYIRAEDARGQEMVRFSVSNDPEFSGKRSMIFAEVERSGANWKFRAIGTPYESDSFVDILRNTYL
ncbi:MAG: stress protein [Candidatus Eremiobacteraeota bacterium]|nr:stress protein [Candidatus Eremiobacteraeota bacterium]